MARYVRIALAGLLVLGLAYGTIVWLGSSAVLEPPWYAPSTPERGLVTHEGNPFYEEGYQGIYRDPGRDFGYAFGEVSFPAADGSTLRGWYVPAAAESAVAVATVHGAGADRRDFLRHLPILHEAGYPVLQFDCREHGISDGAARGVSLGAREHEDVSSAVAWLKEQRGFERVAVLGTSQGGASVILAAAADPAIDAVIAVNPFTRIVDLVRDAEPARGVPLFLIDSIAALAVWRMGAFGLPAPIDVVAKIAPRPLLLMHGTADRAIPYQHSQRLHERAREPNELWILEGAEHAALVNADRDGWRARVVGFLQRWLGPPGGAS